jgi:hypothetical protein
MADHVVKRTLERDVLPYLISARRLKKQWFYRLYMVFGYTTDLVVILASIGVTAPLLRILGLVGTSDSVQPPNLASSLASVPPILVYPAIALILTWVVFRVAFNREEGQKRAVLARSCTQALRLAEAGRPTALGRENPMPELTEILEKRIRPTVDRNIQESAWPWFPFAPSIEADVRKEVDRLSALYETDWAPVVDSGLRQPQVPEVNP